MNRAYRAMAAGVLFLLVALGLDLAGSDYQSLSLLIVSFAFAIGGAVIAVRGVVEFIAERS